MSTNVPESVLQWKLGGKTGNLRSQKTYTENSGYSLLCSRNARYLSYVRQTFGINLGYVSDAKVKKVHFRLPDDVEREIKSGEVVAFGIGGGQEFLKYQHRDVGINLAWSQAPVFEWRIFGARVAKGDPIPVGSAIAIVNDQVQPAPDFLIYLDRVTGADVGWTTSPSFLDGLKSAALKIAVAEAKKALL